MDNNSILLSLLDELKCHVELVNSMERRISQLEQRIGVIDGKTSSSPSMQPLIERDLPQHDEERPKASVGDVMYFNSLQRNEDGEYYIDAKELHVVPDNFRLVISGIKAEGYVCPDMSSTMLSDYRKYLFPLRRPAEDPQGNCRVETETPGRFELKDGRWYMEKKIVIKYLN